MINEFEIDWQQQVTEDSINAILNPEIAGDQVDEISDEIITMQDKMKRCPVFDDDDDDDLSQFFFKEYLYVYKYLVFHLQSS